jgi:hypothetical protein
MTTIAIIALIITAIGSMSIANMNTNAFARSSHHDHEDNEGNNRHVCIVQKHVSVDRLVHVSVLLEHNYVEVNV